MANFISKLGIVPKALIVLAILGGAYYTQDSWLPSRKVVSAVVPKSVSLSDTEVGINNILICLSRRSFPRPVSTCA